MKRTFTHRPSISERARAALVLSLVGLMMAGALVSSYQTAAYFCLLLACAALLLSQLLGDRGFLILAVALLFGSLVLFTAPAGPVAAQLSALL
ncbi:hypothetical protein ACFPAF_16415 [Hymenobacter endophyticus]|uniref:Uncharacterized protein n=1 Tax=Hymenobacter endophyticus TaxID=3076335 RepID=A0ABU3TKT8_9BACT|nr:hypothetical protein [Hymenobacter endophyticus]MDU0371987.1 hypothetical protein [Hymenobacter endophyticus]